MKDRSSSLFILTFLLGVGLFSLSFMTLTGHSACLFYYRFDIPCPSCGMTRSYLQLLHGNIQTAFFIHPLFWVPPLLPLLFLEGRPFSFNKKLREKFCLILVGLFIMVWVVRLLYYYLGTPSYPYGEWFILPFIKTLN